MDRARRTAALTVVGLAAALSTPVAAQAAASPAPATAASTAAVRDAERVAVEQVVARVVEDGRTRLEAFPVDEHGSVEAARRAALASPGVREVAVPVETRLLGSAAAGFHDGAARARQWHLDRLGSEALPAAVTAASGVLVAVLDTGVRVDHEDWATGTVRCDLGADFSDRTRPTTTVGDGCTDPHGHGTHVAGLVAAARDNGRGAAGLSQAQVLPVTVLGPDGSGTDASAAAGIYWAVQRGADVISMSLGGPAAGAHYDDAVAHARAHGVPVVAAAGNDRETGNTPSFPAALPDVIAVAATGTDDSSAPFSYSGPTNDLAAPGVGIVSLGRANATAYASYSGTSQAAPLVAAVAAMWRSRHPAATVAQVTAALAGSATDVGPVGKDPDTGAGVVDPVRLLSSAADTAPAPVPAPAPAPARPPVTPAPGTAPAPVSPPAGSAPVVRPPAPPVARPGLALPGGTVRRGAPLAVTARRLAPRTVVTATARYAVTTRVRVDGRWVSRTVVRSVVLARGRTDAAGDLVARVSLPQAATRVRLVVTGTAAGGRPTSAQSIVTVR